MSDLSEGTYWVDLGFLPAEVGYVPDAKVWKATLAKLGTPDMPFPETDGNCSWFEDMGPDRKLVVLITLGMRPAGFNDTRESMKATTKHLEDMRALAFHKVGAEKP